LTHQHTRVSTAVKRMVKHITVLERAKHSKDAFDLLDEPYSTASFALVNDENEWFAGVAAIDKTAHHRRSLAPRPAGEGRPRTKPAASRTSWIFDSDRACVTGARALYRLKKPAESAAALSAFTQRYVDIMTKVLKDMRNVALPARDKHYLQRRVYRPLHAADALVDASRSLIRALHQHNLTALRAAIDQLHAGLKGLTSLSHQLTAYGAEYCGDFFGTDSKSPGAGSGGSISA
jgi:hypothetical protein